MTTIHIPCIKRFVNLFGIKRINVRIWEGQDVGSFVAERQLPLPVTSVLCSS